MTEQESALNPRSNPRPISGIAKNTSYFTLALVIQKIISFAYFAMLARNLPPDQLGKYYLAISFTTIFAIFIDLGLGNVLTREVAKRKEQARDLLGSVLAIKIPLALLTWGAAIIAVNLLGYEELTRHLVYLSCLCMVFDSFTLTFFSCLRGFHNLTFESIASVTFQLIALIFGFVVIKLELGLIWLMLAMVSASTFNIIFSSSLVFFKWRIKPKLNWRDPLIIKIFNIAIPFALFAVFQRFYMYLDTVLLSLLAGPAQVGLYQVAFKIVFALQFLPMAFIASLYPVFASYWKTDLGRRHFEVSPSGKKSQIPESQGKGESQLSITFERALNYLLIISIPISVGVITLADKIILLFSSEYAAAVLPLQLVMAALVFIFINFPIGSLLNACDKQKINTLNMGITLGASVFLNFILIPLYGVVGASITVIFSNLLMFILGLIQVPRIISFRPRQIALAFIKILFSAIIMAIIILLLKPVMNIFIIILLAGPAYFLVLFLCRGFRKEDIVSIVNSFVKKSV